jgi:hypothetical protein
MVIKLSAYSDASLILTVRAGLNIVRVQFFEFNFHVYNMCHEQREKK